MDDDKQQKYECPLCHKEYYDKSTFNRHINKKKTACLSQQQCKKIVEQMEVKDSRLQYFEVKTQKQKEELEEKISEIQQLKQLVNKLSDKDQFVKESVNDMTDKIVSLQETIDESNQKFYSAANQQIYNQTTINNYNDSKTLFNISLSKEKKERLDHITHDMMLTILDHENVNDTLGDLTRIIYFHPKAPENFKWCVIDRLAQFGTLEYNADTNTVVRKMTSQVIRKNMQNVMFPVADILEELRRKRQFNHSQAVNYSRLINMMGNDFTQEQVNSMRDSAYAGRNFPKALWENIDVPIEATPVTCQIEMQSTKSMKMEVE